MSCSQSFEADKMSYSPGVQSPYSPSDNDDDRYFSYYHDEFDDYDSDYLERARTRARATQKASQKAEAQRMLLKVAFGFTDKGKRQSCEIQRAKQDVTEPKHQPSTLLDTCARFVGQNLPFESVQVHSQRIPEEVQSRVAYWSFPLSEERVLEYIKMMGVDDLTISRAKRLVGGEYSVPYGRTHGGDFVQDVTQIGEWLIVGLSGLPYMHACLLICSRSYCMLQWYLAAVNPTGHIQQPPSTGNYNSSIPFDPSY